MKLLPARKIYYGWYILVGVILAQFMATSTGQMVSGVFLDPLVEALQIEVWQFAAAISLATALGGISMVFIGPLVDRIGPRRLMLAGAMFSAIGLVGLSIQSAFIFFFLFQAINRALGPNLYGGAGPECHRDQVVRCKPGVGPCHRLNGSVSWRHHRADFDDVRGRQLRMAHGIRDDGGDSHPRHCSHRLYYATAAGGRGPAAGRHKPEQSGGRRRRARPGCHSHRQQPDPHT